MSNQQKTAGKKKQIHLRVTEDELHAIREKARNYTSLSALMIDAAKDFNTKKGRNKIDLMIELSSCLSKFEVETARRGNNLNQIAHALNLYQYEQIALPPFELVGREIKETLKLSKDILRELRAISETWRL